MEKLVLKYEFSLIVKIYCSCLKTIVYLLSRKYIFIIRTKVSNGNIMVYSISNTYSDVHTFFKCSLGFILCSKLSILLKDHLDTYLKEFVLKIFLSEINIKKAGTKLNSH